MKHLGRRSSACILLAMAPLLALGKNGPRAQRSPSQATAPAAPQPDRGQQVFVRNCSRCHNAPTGFSPRISGTIARHMRVRAELSDEDYKELRRFLAP